MYRSFTVPSFLMAKTGDNQTCPRCENGKLTQCTHTWQSAVGHEMKGALPVHASGMRSVSSLLLLPLVGPWNPPRDRTFRRPP